MIHQKDSIKFICKKRDYSISRKLILFLVLYKKHLLYLSIVFKAQSFNNPKLSKTLLNRLAKNRIINLQFVLKKGDG